MTPLENALRLAGRGKPVFPCRVTKEPATPNGFKNASSDPQEVRQLWARYGGQLIGMPTGAASGFDVLDTDPRHGSDDWMAEYASYLPETLIVRTRSGGQHFYFRAREGMRNSESKIAPGVDVRAEGGYVIAWAVCGGAVQHRAPIADWPEWLAEIALPRLPQPISSQVATKLPRAANGNREANSAWRLIESSLTAVRTAPEGQKHYRLRAASRTIGGLLDLADVSANEAAQALLRAVEAAGAANLAGAAKTIEWGLNNGRGAPLVMGARR
jgi:hypothetical protein